MPIVSFPIGARRFAPSWLMTLLTIALGLLFFRLGQWQWDRGVHRQAEWDAFARGADAPLPLGAQNLGSLARFRRISVAGSWDAAHQFLIDNRSHGGLPRDLCQLAARRAQLLTGLLEIGDVPTNGVYQTLVQRSLP